MLFERVGTRAGERSAPIRVNAYSSACYILFIRKTGLRQTDDGLVRSSDGMEISLLIIRDCNHRERGIPRAAVVKIIPGYSESADILLVIARASHPILLPFNLINFGAVITEQEQTTDRSAN